MDNYFNKLNGINVNDKTEKKGNLTYLSWAYAWTEVKKLYPEANYTIYENTLPNGYVVNYFTDGRTAWVKTGVTIEGIEHIEELPVMNFSNKSLPLEQLTSFDVNKTIQRSLTKAVARHGLGLYIYAGEDLPEEAEKITSDMEQGLRDLIKAKQIQSSRVQEILKEYGYKKLTDIKIDEVVKIRTELSKC